MLIILLLQFGLGTEIVREPFAQNAIAFLVSLLYILLFEIPTSSEEAMYLVIKPFDLVLHLQSVLPLADSIFVFLLGRK